MKRPDIKSSIAAFWGIPLYIALVPISAVGLWVAVTEWLIYKALSRMGCPLPKLPNAYSPQMPQDEPESENVPSESQQVVRTIESFVEGLAGSEEAVVDEIRVLLECSPIGRVAVEHGLQCRDHDYLVLKPDKKESIRRICGCLLLIPNSSAEQFINLLHKKKALIELRKQEESNNGQRL